MIKTVTKARYNLEFPNEVTSYNLERKDGIILSVPLDPNNRDYQDIQEWVADGNTIEEGAN